MDFLPESDDEPDDIFDTLDASFSDVFTVSQLRELRRMARIHNLRSATDLLNFLREQHDHRLFRMRWIWDIIPVPSINLALLRRHHSARTVAISIVSLAQAALILTKRLIVAAGYYFCLMFVIQTVVNQISIFVFSENFLVDISTYMLRNYPLLMDARRSIALGDIDSYVDFDNASLWQMFKAVASAFLSMAIRVRCEKNAKDEITTCDIDTNSLIFKFSDILRSYLPPLPSPLHTAAVVIFYVTYGLAAQLITTNMCAHYGYFLVCRVFRPCKFMIRLGKLLWLNAKNTVI